MVNGFVDGGGLGEGKEKEKEKESSNGGRKEEIDCLEGEEEEDIIGSATNKKRIYYWSL